MIGHGWAWMEFQGAIAMTEFHPDMATCPQCGGSFWRDARWKVICVDCWRDKKTAQETPKPREIIRYVEIPASPIEPDMLRRLVQLCHPDKHGGSEAANIATRYLLELRGQHG